MTIAKAIHDSLLSLRADRPSHAGYRGLFGRTDGAEGAAETSPDRFTREERVMELYDQLRPALLTYLSTLGASWSEAEDIVQDCFIRLFRHLEANRDDQNLRGWLFRVSYNLAMDRFRGARTICAADDGDLDFLERIADQSLNPEEATLQNEEIRRVAACLGQLTQQQRAAVLLRAESLRHREIATILGVSTKRAGELIQRALMRLAGEL